MLALMVDTIFILALRADMIIILALMADTTRYLSVNGRYDPLP